MFSDTCRTANINFFINFLSWQVIAVFSLGVGVFLGISQANDDEVLKKQTEGMTPEELADFQQQQKLIAEEQYKSSVSGYVNEALICPHCQNKGTVRTMKTTQVTKNRVNSVVGQAVGLGTNSSKDVTQMHCDNCQTTWVV